MSIQRLLLGAGLALLALRSASAQELRGTVLDQMTREPVRGAVLTLLDSAGLAIGRRLTSERGEYRVNWTPAVRRIRFVRLGYRPVERSVSEPVNDARVDVTMVRLTTFLEQVQVSAKACPRRSRGSAVALLEQAKAALLATVVAREARPDLLVRLVYEREMDGTSDRIRRQSVRVDSSSRAASSFSAVRGAGGFVRRGFRDDIAGHHMFYAPDADVLLHEEFANGYCFHVADADRFRTNQVGLGFYAPDQQLERIDVEGALWIDTLERSMRGIEFRYAGLDPALLSYRPGGRIAFREMPNGLVIIDRWNLRLVSATADSFPRPDGRVTTVPRFYASESGGEVASVRWPDGTTWTASLGALEANARRPDSLAAADARLWLVDTPYRVTVAASGAFTIPELLPGPYEMVAVDPRLDSIDVTIPVLKFTAVRDSVERRSIVVRTAEEFVADRCIADKRHARGDSLLLIRVMSPDNLPVGRTTLDVSITEHPVSETLGPFSAKTESAGRRLLRQGAVTGSDGMLAVCSGSIRKGLSLYVRARHAGQDTTIIHRVHGRLTVLKIMMN